MTPERREKRIRYFLMFIFVASVLLLTVPTLMVIFYHISEKWFKILNTTGLLLATLRIVLSMATSIGVTAIKGESTPFKKSTDKEAKYLFILTIIIQFINMSFIHFD